jgi:hypothetical protein
MSNNKFDRFYLKLLSMKAAFTSKQNFENDVAVQLLQIILVARGVYDKIVSRIE